MLDNGHIWGEYLLANRNEGLIDNCKYCYLHERDELKIQDIGTNRYLGTPRPPEKSGSLAGC